MICNLMQNFHITQNTIMKSLTHYAKTLFSSDTKMFNDTLSYKKH